MDRRTKILTALFATVLLYALVSTVAYPRWIEPLLNIDQRIAERQEEYDRLRTLEDAVDRAAKQYREMVARVGSFDVTKVATEVRSQINGLIDKHQLQGANVAPSRPTTDRKTDLTTMQITVSAEGRLKSVVEFLKDLAEMRQLVRIGDAAVYPASGSRRRATPDLMHLRVPLEVMVLPQQKVVGRIDLEDLSPPESIPPRHEGRDYAMIWSKKPFTEPIPLSAEAGQDARVGQGQPARLIASAGGGTPPYSIRWEPTVGLDDPAGEKPLVDTSSAFTRVYRLLVTDAEGETAQDTVTVTVMELPKPVRDGPDPAPPRPVRASAWPDAPYKQLTVTLLRSLGSDQVDEVMIYNNRSRQTEYYAVGDDFNGGELVFVHPRGGIVRRNNEYLLYPVGATLDQEIDVKDDAAQDHPELKEAAETHRRALEAPKQGPETLGQGQPGGTEAAGLAGPRPPGAAPYLAAESVRKDDAGKAGGAESAGRSQAQGGSAARSDQEKDKRKTEPRTRRIQRWRGRP